MKPEFREFEETAKVCFRNNFSMCWWCFVKLFLHDLQRFFVANVLVVQYACLVSLHWVYIYLSPGCVAVPLVYAPYKCAIPRDSACSRILSLTQQKRLTSIELFIEYTELGSSLSLSSYSF